MPGAAADAAADAVVVGGGFYGAMIAAYLVRQRGFGTVLLVEREAALLSRASLRNQARIHNGYHYPRSYTTAYRSRVNLPRFVADWPQAVTRDFTKLYAIARRNSKVSARQFHAFCRAIGAGIERADADVRGLFDPRLVEEVFRVEEFAFDSTVLAAWARQELAACGVMLAMQTTVVGVTRGAGNVLRVGLRTADGSARTQDTHYLFNCSYSGLNQLGGDFTGTATRLKQEIAEIALLEVPDALRGLGVTVMDGPFFSLMPFPARGLHSLSHVRYTPHSQWIDRTGLDPYDKLDRYDRVSRIDRMLRDVVRYLPALQDARYVESLFEVKTVLEKNEGDDGRPILFERHAELPGCYSVLGGKIDNIYDVLERFDAEPLLRRTEPTFQSKERPLSL